MHPLLHKIEDWIFILGMLNNDSFWLILIAFARCYWFFWDAPFLFSPNFWENRKFKIWGLLTYACVSMLYCVCESLLLWISVCLLDYFVLCSRFFFSVNKAYCVIISYDNKNFVRLRNVISFAAKSSMKLIMILVFSGKIASFHFAFGQLWTNRINFACY